MSRPAPIPSPLAPRAERLARLAEGSFRCLVVGGGATGAGIAHDLALRGVPVALVERGDWASGTSSASSRLIHGGLRYLEQRDFALVRESCLERARLLRNAAGLVWPERFSFPSVRGGVGRVKLAAGLALYTALSLPEPLGLPRLIGARALARRLPGVRLDGLRGAGEYQDGATDDARLVLAVVKSAAAAGAVVVSRVELTALEQGSTGVVARLEDRLGGALEVRADAAVLAGGPYVDALRARAGLSGPAWVAPTRGAHVLVPRDRLPTDGAVILASPVDGRVMFLLPWPRFTAIGTTDLEASPQAEVRATRAEVRYLLDSANGLVPEARLGEDDVRGTWAGLRPLLASGADPSARSREERIETEGRVVTIAGGKLTAYRAMAESAAARVLALLGLPAGPSPTRDRHLSGAVARPVGRPAWSSLGPDGRPVPRRDPVADAWAHRYVALSTAVGQTCALAPGGREPLDAQTLAGEVDWAVLHEDALLPSDVLLRRTDLAFQPSEAEAEAAARAVVQRMAPLCGWTGDALFEAERDALAVLERMRAWRGDAPS